ncbi:Hypothetical protein POVN_LOCUS480 [uncultured virus]|nr:Hypothetical protein POVN_LOCUS480 [uncultured virus]
MMNVPLAPYLFAILFFIVAYLLITTPVYSFLVYHSESDLHARYTIAILLAGLAFFAVALSIKDDEQVIAPP